MRIIYIKIKSFIILDCSDFSKVKKIMKNIDIVYHCAATAHEGFEKSVFSPYEIDKK